MKMPTARGPDDDNSVVHGENGFEIKCPFGREIFQLHEAPRGQPTVYTLCNYPFRGSFAV